MVGEYVSVCFVCHVGRRVSTSHSRGFSNTGYCYRFLTYGDYFSTEFMCNPLELLVPKLDMNNCEIIV